MARLYEPVWASAWGEEANRAISPTLGLESWPTIPFPPTPFHPRAKVPAIGEFVGGRACAWLEDEMTREAYEWAESREAATLLVDIDPTKGLTREHVERCLSWVTD